MAEEPLYFGTKISSICSLLPRPLVMTGYFRDILIRHFSTPGHIEHTELKHLIWSNTFGQSRILIESVHRWLPQYTEQRPAVIIKRNAYQNRRVGIGDRHQGPPADRRGDPHYSTMWIGSHTLFCIGGTGAQAELLATEVQREMTEFAPCYLRDMKLHRFQVVEVGAVGELEEATENFVVPVTVGYAFMQNWTIVQQAPTLNHVSLSLILEA